MMPLMQAPRQALQCATWQRRSTVSHATTQYQKRLLMDFSNDLSHPAESVHVFVLKAGGTEQLMQG